MNKTVGKLDLHSTEDNVSVREECTGTVCSDRTLWLDSEGREYIYFGGSFFRLNCFCYDGRSELIRTFDISRPLDPDFCMETYYAYA